MRLRRPTAQGARSGLKPLSHGSAVRRALAPLVSAAAILYFLVDAVLLAAIRPDRVRKFLQKDLSR
jgi:hypothetical protein